MSHLSDPEVPDRNWSGRPFKPVNPPAQVALATDSMEKLVLPAATDDSPARVEVNSITILNIDGKELTIGAEKLCKLFPESFSRCYRLSLRPQDVCIESLPEGAWRVSFRPDESSQRTLIIRRDGRIDGVAPYENTDDSLVPRARIICVGNDRLLCAPPGITMLSPGTVTLKTWMRSLNSTFFGFGAAGERYRGVVVGSCYVDMTGQLLLSDGGLGPNDQGIGLKRVKVTVRNTGELSFSAEVESALAYMFPWEAPLEMDVVWSQRKFYKMVDAAGALKAKRQQRN